MTQTALTISQFCQAHSISRNLFYTLKKQGLAPKMIAVGITAITTAISRYHAERLASAVGFRMGRHPVLLRSYRKKDSSRLEGHLVLT